MLGAVPSPLTDEDLLSRLVSFDTTSERSNLPLIDFVCDYLDSPGVRVDRLITDDGSKANLLVRAGPDPDVDRGGLVLCGHTDVVPAREEGWLSDPFTLIAKDAALVGRGACDMKGFLALAVNAFVEADPARLSRPLALLFTHDEEVGTLGARRFAESWEDPRALPRRTIVGEPTDLAVVRLHKGHLRGRVVVRGRSAHSAYPHLGRSAIEPAARAVTALAALGRELAAERPPNGEFFGAVPFVTLNVGRIFGGVADNVVPARCEVDIGLRPLPGMAADALLERVRSALSGALDGEEWTLERVNESPPATLEAEADLHRALCADLGQIGTRAVSFATDAGWLSRMGLECVVFGPGSIEAAHKPNESVPRADLERARSILERAIDRWCRPAPGEAA